MGSRGGEHPLKRPAHQNRMRVCPTVEGSSTPLILHRISAADCQSRQQCNYHKCHRCVYQGKGAAWEPEAPLAGTEALQPVGARGVPTQKSAPVADPAKTVELPRKPAAKPGKQAPARSASAS
jgi:hypothetical protein